MNKSENQVLGVRVFGVIDPEEFLQEVVAERFVKLPYFLNYEFIDDGCEYIIYLYFRPEHKEQAIRELDKECLIYELE